MNDNPSELLLTFKEICKLSEDETMWGAFMREWDIFKLEVKKYYPRVGEDNYLS